MLPQHPTAGKQLVTALTGKLLSPVHVHMLPEGVPHPEGEMTNWTLGVIPPNSRHGIGHLWNAPGLWLRSRWLLSLDQSSHLTLHHHQGSLFTTTTSRPGPPLLLLPTPLQLMQISALVLLEPQLVVEPMVQEAWLHSVPGLASGACPLPCPHWTAQPSPHPPCPVGSCVSRVYSPGANSPTLTYSGLHWL